MLPLAKLGSATKITKSGLSFVLTINFYYDGGHE